MPAERIQYGWHLKRGTDELNKAIDAANAAEVLSTNADSKATQALSNSVNTQEQLDTIVIEGDSSVEAAQARIPVEGTAYPTLKARLDAENQQLTADLAETTKQELGAYANLNEMLNTLNAEGYKYGFINNTNELEITAPLTTLKNVSLQGEAELKNDVLANYFLPYTRLPAAQFSGKINAFKAQSPQFKNFRKALTENRNLKVTIWGDSILANDDMLGVKKNKVDGTQRIYSPDGLTFSDAVFHRIVNSMLDRFDTKTFDFYNRAIAGESLTNWNANKTFNATSKTWIEHIKDTNPDLLIIGFGMNHTSYASSFNFAYELKQVMDYMKANFTKVPDLVFITPPRPTNMIGETWGSFEGQSARQNVADTLRSYGKSNGGYIVDVNKIGNAKRLGKTLTDPHFKKVPNIASFIINTAPELGGVFTFENPTDSITIDKNVKNFILSFTLTPMAVPSNTEDNLYVTFNNTEVGGGNMLMILPSIVGTNAQIRSYAKRADTRWGTVQTQLFDASLKYDVTTNIKIEKRDDVIEMTVNDYKVIRDISEINNMAGTIFIKKEGTAGYKVEMSNIELFVEEYEDYIPTVSEYDMWGNYVAGDFTKKTPYGGNGVNHPSTIGIEEVYVPAINEFADDLALFSSQYLSPFEVGYMQKTLTPTLSLIETSFYYTNFPSTPFDLTNITLKVNGVFKTYNKTVVAYSQRANLAEGEFAVYETGGTVQLLYKSGTTPNNVEVSMLLQ